MAQDRIPPRPHRAPEWVGPDERRRDVSAMTDRAISVMALDRVERVAHAVAVQTDNFNAFVASWDQEKISLLKELPEHARRIGALEMGRGVEFQSSHDWNKLLEDAGTALSKRVKDPRDRLDSDRARKIAEEVVQGVKTADDAKAFRTWRSRGMSIAIETLKGVAILIAGAVAAHYGWR